MKLRTLTTTAALAGALLGVGAIPALAAAPTTPTAVASQGSTNGVVSYSLRVKNDTPWDLRLITTQSDSGWYGNRAPDTHGPARPAARGGLDGLTVAAGTSSRPQPVRTYGDYGQQARFTTRVASGAQTVSDLTVSLPAGAAGLNANWQVNEQPGSTQIGWFQGNAIYASVTPSGNTYNQVLTIGVK